MFLIYSWKITSLHEPIWMLQAEQASMSNHRHTMGRLFTILDNTTCKSCGVLLNILF